MPTTTSSRPRQAVVVIHGIGEQRPMQTLRGFVGALLGDLGAHGSPPRFYSKPDRLTDTLELRRLSAPVSEAVPAPTDFYELYWAHLIQGTVWSQVVAWLRVLLFRLPVHARQRIRLLWGLSWALLLLVTWVAYQFWPRLAAVDAISLGFIGVLALAGVRLIGRCIGLHYVGDAARYLSSTPQNIEARKTIRNAVIDLLTKLHDEPLQRYERIIVVGHSLGSVIAYDALTHLWQARHSVIKNPRPVDQPVMHEVEKAGAALGRSDVQCAKALAVYRCAQRKLLAEQRHVGVDWRITDLVTLGSPLAHAAFLLAASPAEWADLKRERVYPTSPPQSEDERDEGLLVKSFAFEDKQRYDIKILHHAALFACTRWTNLYFPADLIGGPVAGKNEFGLGVRDMKLVATKLATRWTPLAHVRYWNSEEIQAVCKLKAALGLGDLWAPSP